MASTSEQWHGDTEPKPAPDPLGRIQALVNTIDLESGEDRLAIADDAKRWLVANHLLAADVNPGVDDLCLVIGVREGLRALVIHNSGGPIPDPAVTAPLHRVAVASAFRAVVDEHGRVALAAEADSIHARLASLLLIVKDAQVDGSWTHLKACANGDCSWVFYDRSRNHGGLWCDMASCGNKVKNRDFRARRRAESKVPKR